MIIYPLKPKLKQRFCFVIVLNIWILSILFSSLHLYSFKANLSNGTTYCLPNQNYELFQKHSLFLIFYQFFFPLLFISIPYSRIVYKLFFKKQPIILGNIVQEKNKKKVFWHFFYFFCLSVWKKRLIYEILISLSKAIKMLLIVIVLFMASWAPIQIYNFLSILVPEINEYFIYHLKISLI